MTQLLVADPATWADVAARELAGAIAFAAARRPTVTVALSGGSTPTPVFERLALAELPWDRIVFTQVDERLAPDGDPDRNLTAQQAALGRTGAGWAPLPVDGDPETLAEFERTLAPRLDVVHLGLGADGHTASLVPDDPVLDVVDRRIALTGPYEGRRRITHTFPSLNAVAQRGGRLVWLVKGSAKAEVLRRAVAGDPSIPAGRVRGDRALWVVNVDES